MRCFFWKNGHIVSKVELSICLQSEEAIAACHKLFQAAPNYRFDSFEIWEMTHFILRHEGRTSLMPSPPP